MTDLERSHAELRAAVTLAGKEIRKLNFGDSCVFPLSALCCARRRVMYRGLMIQPVRSADSLITLLLDGLAEAFHKKSWHGPNLRSALRGVTVKQAAWRPGDERHNIWELALHAAYWKYVVRRKLAGDKRGGFVLKGSNFFQRPEGSAGPSEGAWRDDIAILETEHKMLYEVVANLRGTPRLEAKTWQAKVHLIRGAAAHDLYHAGQIRLLRRLCPL